MAAATSQGDTMASMNGLLKEKYAKTIQNLVPDNAKLTKRIPFSKKTSVGNYYHQPVILQNEVGFTYNAGNGSNLFGYNPVAPMQMKDAQVAPTQLLLRSAIGYEIMQRAKEAGEEAFEAATLLLVKNMAESMAARLEMALLYGGFGLGTIATAGAVTLVSGAVYSSVFTLTLSQFAVGIWQGQETSNIDVYQSGSVRLNSTTVGTTNAPMIYSFNPASRQLVVYGTQADLVAIKAYVDANVDAARIFWGDAFGQEMVGLKSILSNTGTLFNIDASVYDLWKGNTVAVGGVALTQSILQQVVAVLTGRGLGEEDLLFVCSPQGWADLMNSQAALRVYDKSYNPKEIENGGESLKFRSQNGSIEVLAHPMCKDGDAFLVPAKRLLRIGACEPTFEQPGYESKLPFVPLENTSGLQIVRYASQQVFLETPSRAALLTGIVNTSSAS